ncbi:MAG: hypothetical protein HRU20_27535 [Pseudomonadales bacterium]|nr:hypothetical protein [Pseudomonadales bacterium]
MKASKNSIIPLEPDTHKELDKVLKAGESAKVMLEGRDTVFIMTKAEKGDEYDLSQVTSESSSDEMRRALEKIKDKMK